MVQQKYIRGIGLLAAKNSQGQTTGYLFNAHGDVVQLTDSSGNVTRDYDYDAFGVEKPVAGNPAGPDANPFRYCGEYFDAETGSVYLRNRYYDPRTGRFGAEDPIRDGFNWYTYAGNNPVAFADPYGLAREDVYGIASKVRSGTELSTSELEMVDSWYSDWSISDPYSAWGEFLFYTDTSLAKLSNEQVYAAYDAWYIALTENGGYAPTFSDSALNNSSWETWHAFNASMNGQTTNEYWTSTIIAGTVNYVANLAGYYSAVRATSPRVQASNNTGNNTTRVGRWMSVDEYNKMLKTERVQMSQGNQTHVSIPNNNSYSAAPKGSIYVEFDVPFSALRQGGRSDWMIINGPGSLGDRFGQRQGLPAITEMPQAYNIMRIQ